MSFLRDMAFALLLLEDGKREQSYYLMKEVIHMAKIYDAWGTLEEEMLIVYLEELKAQHTVVSSLLNLSLQQ